MAEKYLNYDGLDELVTQIKAKLLGKVDVTAGVTNVAYDSSSKKLKQTINGSASDVVTFGDNAFTSTSIPTAASQLSDYSDLAQASDVSAIEAKIPSAASSSNQLADKAFVNSSISTATATFRGTYNLVSDLSLTPSATHSDIAIALGIAISTVDANDYCFVQIPTSTSTPTEIASIERYKYATGWEYEYTLNNSGFTATQWAAINSGATTTNIGQIATNTSNISSLNTNKVNKTTTIAGVDLQDNITKSELQTALTDTTHSFVTDTEKTTWNAKQDALTAGDNITITNNVISAEKGVKEITSESVRITDLTSGVYKLNQSNPYIYYNGTSGTNYIYLGTGQANVEAILVVNKIATVWSWYVIVAETVILGSGPTYLYFGATDSSGGSYTKKSLKNIPDGIADNLTSNWTGYALDAHQGYVLKALIDTLPDTAITTAEIDALFN